MKVTSIINIVDDKSLCLHKLFLFSTLYFLLDISFSRFLHKINTIIINYSSCHHYSFKKGRPEDFSGDMMFLVLNNSKTSEHSKGGR